MALNFGRFNRIVTNIHFNFSNASIIKLNKLSFLNKGLSIFYRFLTDNQPKRTYPILPSLKSPFPEYPRFNPIFEV